MSKGKEIDGVNTDNIKYVQKRGHRSRTMAEVTAEALALVDKDGKTRGKNPRDIKFKVLNRVPSSMKEYMALVQPTESDTCEVLFEGYNSLSYSAASDEIGEFIPEGWDKETQAQFRLAVRNFSKVANMSIEDAVKMILPGVEKAVAAKAAAVVTPTPTV